MIFWKEAWLRDVSGKSPASPADPDRCRALHFRLKTTVAPDQFSCQATSLASATKLLSRGERAWKCFRDVRVGTYSTTAMIGLIVGPVFRKLRRAIRGEWPRGTLSTTPAESLNLQPGEWIEVKPLAEIAQTLDARGRNRGLHFSEDMSVFCGGRYRVRNRLDRMIFESTGRLREIRNTVILEAVKCGCPYTLGGCPRAVFQYWREIWLKRAPIQGINSPLEGCNDIDKARHQRTDPG